MSAKLVEEELCGIDVSVDGLGGLLGDQGHANGCGQMVDRIDIVAGFLHTGGFAEVGADDAEVGIGFEVFEVPAVAGAEIVDHDDMIASLKKMLGKVRADEAATAGN
jgi:hypothetical protein